jgi:hypothetical protein
MEKITLGAGGQDDSITRDSKFAYLCEDPAFKAFLSKETKNDSAEFVDYAVTRSLVRNAIDDAMSTLGIRL